MALDRSVLHAGFKVYLENAEKASGMSYEDFAVLLAKSGASKHGELRSRLMEKAGLGHGHANAVVAIWLKLGTGGGAAAQPTAKMAVRTKAPAGKK